MKQIAIKGKCNINCTFCNYSNEPYAVDVGAHYNEVIRALDKARKQEKEIVFGVDHYEPTTFPRFLDVVKYAKKLGFKKLILQTNLIKLSDEDYAKSLKSAGIDRIFGTLFGYDNESSNSIAQSKENIFDKKRTAISNCLKLGYDIHLCILILTQNYFNISKIFNSYLPKTRQLSTKDITLLIPDPATEPRNKLLMPSYTSILPYVKKLCEQHPRYRFNFITFPLCLLENETTPKNLRFTNKPEEAKKQKQRYIKKCLNCNLRKKCAGIFRDYLKIYGSGEFDPHIDPYIEKNYHIKKIKRRMKGIKTPLRISHYGKFTKFLFSYLPGSKKHSRILELGAFLGFYVDFLQRKGYNITGVDRDMRYVSIAKTLGNKILRLDALLLDRHFKKDSFDIVFAINFFHPDLPIEMNRELLPSTIKSMTREEWILKIFEQTYAVLKEGGLFISNFQLELPTNKIKKMGFVESPGGLNCEGHTIFKKQNLDEGPKKLDADCTFEKKKWISITGLCNNNCRFCLDSGRPDKQHRKQEDIKKEIKEAKKQGNTKLVLSGGDPTIHPNIIDFVRYAKRIGYNKIQVITNGRMFASKKFTGDIITAGLDEVTFSIHGYNSKMHDALTRVPGSFKQTLLGVRNVQGSTKKMIVNTDTCVTKSNYKELLKIITFIVEKAGINEVNLMTMVPQGNAWKYRKEILYDYAKTTPFVHEAIDYCRAKNAVLWLSRFPPELLEGYESHITDAYKMVDDVRGCSKDIFEKKEEPACFGEKCKYCGVNAICGDILKIRKLSIAKKQEKPKANFKIIEINKDNYKNLPDSKDIIIKYPDPGRKLIDCKGVFVKFSLLSPFLSNLKKSKFKDIPPCIVDKKRIIHNKPKLKKEYFNNGKLDYVRIAEDLTLRVKIKRLSCKECRHHDSCEGTYQKYFRLFGFEEVQAVK